jgi:hypothetical protein
MKAELRLVRVEVLTDGTKIKHYLKPDGRITIRVQFSHKGGISLASLFSPPPLKS